MGTVLIHAGMPKTGSTSIQTWLRRHGSKLREEYGISILDVTETQTGPGRFTAAEARSNPNTISFLMRYHVTRQLPDTAAELHSLASDFVDALDQAATDRGTVLLTAETFSTFFIEAEAPFLLALDRLAQRHTVRTACYVRPQHTALEARWRQWGFRSELSPSKWVVDQAHHLRYADTLDQVRRLAPALSFDVRPFRPDLLEGGDVVVDFAKGFLGIDDPPGVENNNENPGLSLDLAILLRGAPTTLTDDPGAKMQTGARQLALGKLGRSWNIHDSDAAAESRRVLHHYAHDEFEPRNRDLIADLGWPTESFVPPPEPVAQPDAGLTALDELWAPPASEGARAYLYAALSALVTKPRPQDRS